MHKTSPYITRELEMFLERAKNNQLVSLVVVGSTTDHKVLCAWDVSDFLVLGALDYAKLNALACVTTVEDEPVLNSNNEENTQDGGREAQVDQAS